MVGQPLWEKLKTLVCFDKQLDETEQKIQQTQKIIENDQLTIPKLKTLIEKNEEDYLKEKKNLNQLELNATELKEKEIDKKNLLEKITNQKEYKAFEKEFKKISQQRIMQDDLLIKSWHQIEISQKKFEKEKAEKEKTLNN